MSHPHDPSEVARNADPVLLPHPPIPEAHRPAPPDEPGAEHGPAEPEPQPPRGRSRVVGALSSPQAMAATVLVAVVGLMLAFYVAVAQINLTDCLADYNEQSAKVTAARAQAAGEDRALEAEARKLDARDRRLNRIDDSAIDTALGTISDTRGFAGRAEAFTGLLRQRVATNRERDAIDLARAELENQRQVIEIKRKRNPPPPPPSQTCD